MLTSDTAAVLLITFALLFTLRRIRHMSASTDSLSAAVADLAMAVSVAIAAIQDLKSKLPDPADAAAVDKAVVDVMAASEALKAAVV